MASVKQAGRYAFAKDVITTPVGLISYPKVWDAVENTQNGKYEFQCSILVPKQGVDLSGLIGPSMEAVRELFGETYKKLSDFGDRCPLKDGDIKDPNGPGHGHFIIPSSCSVDYRPFVVDKTMRPIGDKTAIYGGAIGILFVQPMAYHNQFGKGVKFMLKGVQKIADGKSFGASPYDPTSAGFKTPEVPNYLKGHMEDRQGGYVPPQVAGRSNGRPLPYTQADADRAAIAAFAAGQQYNTITHPEDQVDDDSIPF